MIQRWYSELLLLHLLSHQVFCCGIYQKSSGHNPHQCIYSGWQLQIDCVDKQFLILEVSPVTLYYRLLLIYTYELCHSPVSFNIIGADDVIGILFYLLLYGGIIKLNFSSNLNRNRYLLLILTMSAFMSVFLYFLIANTSISKLYKLKLSCDFFNSCSASALHLQGCVQSFFS